MKKKERASINDDIRRLQKAGKSVIVIESATKQDIINAITDPEAKIIVTSGHGYNPKQIEGIQTADGGIFSPNDVDANTVSQNLKTIIFENCYQGDIEDKWETAFGNNIDVVGWKGITNIFETVSFNGLGLFDRQDENLRDYLKNAFNDKNENKEGKNK